jgi:hypothetical protein
MMKVIVDNEFEKRCKTMTNKTASIRERKTIGNLNGEYGQDVSRELVRTVEQISRYLTNPILESIGERVKLRNEQERSVLF